MITDDAGKRWVIVHNEPAERVRRYPVPGGWLYQVEKSEMSVSSKDGWATTREGWHPPVFVADNLAATESDRLLAKIADGVEDLSNRRDR